MPIPTPNPGESFDKFIERCMSDENMVSEYPQDQRFGDAESLLLGECLLEWYAVVGRTGNADTFALHILYAVQQGSDIHPELLRCYRPNAF